MTISILNIRLVAALAIAFVAVSPIASLASDVPVPTYTKASVIAPGYNWSGFYIGGDIGGAFQRGSGTSNFFENGDINNFQRQSAGGDSVIGGFHAGYNWQFAPSWVVGIEGDWQWSASRSSACRQTSISSEACSDNGFGFVTINGDTRSIGTARARFGWTADRVMIYGTGGVAFSDVRASLGVSCLNGCGASSESIATAASSSTLKTGWVAGAGVEWMLSPNWIGRAEYLHADFGSLLDILNLPSDNCFFGGPCGVSWSRDLRYDIVRAGISYKFNP
ncbi:MAG: outer membrane protein [Afipia sp.]